MSIGTLLEAATAQPHRILVLGGAYAGLALVHNLLRQARGIEPDGSVSTTAIRTRRPLEITILDERDGFYHTIGSPLSFASESYGNKAWRTFDDIPKLQHAGVSVLRGRVTAIDCEKRTATYTPSNSTGSKSQAYDYLAVCTGLRRNWPVVPKELTKAGFLAETQDFIKGIKESDDGVVVIGAGAVGVEVASELKMIYPNTIVRLIHAHDKMLSSEPLPDELKERVGSILTELGVDFVSNERVAGIKTNPPVENKPETYTVHLQSGKEFKAGKVINSVSRGVPNTDFLPSGALSAEKYVNIRPTLQFATGTANADFHWAAGDLCQWSGIKRVGLAMSMGSTAATNMYRHILAREREYEQLTDGSDLTAESIETKLDDFPHVPAMIALACGKQSVTYHPDNGVQSSEDLMKIYFGDDLGLEICWNCMKLGEKFEVNGTA